MTSAKLPISAPAPIELPARRWANGPTEAPSATSDDSTTLVQTTQPAPIVLSTIWLPAPMVVPYPTRVRPRRMTFGSRVTSDASSTVAST